MDGLSRTMLFTVRWAYFWTFFVFMYCVSIGNKTLNHENLLGLLDQSPSRWANTGSEYRIM